VVEQWEKLKRIKDELAVEQEQSAALGLRMDRILSKRPGSLSKVSNPKTRSDLFDDLAILKRIKASVQKGRRVALTSGPSRLVEEDRPISIELEDDKDGPIDLIHVRHWDHTSPILKSLAYGAAIPSERRYALTIRLDPDLIVSGLRSQRGFVGYFQDRITRSLRKRLGDHPVPDFVIAAEGVPLEDFHLHGAIELPADEAQVALIKEALIEASGNIEGAGRARKVHFKPINNLAGWFVYICKARLSTAQNLSLDRKRRGLEPRPSESIIGVTLPLRRAGKAWFVEARAKEIST